MSRSKRRTPISCVCADSDKLFKQAEHRRERTAVRVAVEQGSEPPSPREFGDPWKGQKDGKLYEPGRPELLRK